MNTLQRQIRDYKINFAFNSKYESILVPGQMYESVLDHSKACIHIYLYICLSANKNKDLGYFRNVKTVNIFKDLNIPLRTVQFAIKELKDYGYIDRSFNGDKTIDIYVNGYTEMVQAKNYIKVPGEIVFTDDFLKMDKAEMVGFLEPYSLIYKNTIASMQRIKDNSEEDGKENWEVVYSAKTDRDLTEKYLLTKLKRVSSKHLNSVINKIRSLGFMDILESGETADKGMKYTFKMSKKIIGNLFSKKSNDYIKTHKLSLRSVENNIKEFGLSQYFNTKQHLNDLVQMFGEYGQALFYYGMNQLDHVRKNNHGEFIDENGESVDNLCGYMRRTINNFIEELSNKNNTLKESVVKRFKNLVAAA